MEKWGKTISVFLAGLFLAISATASLAAVSVYAEAAYRDSDLVVYIFADIDGEAILSGGVTLTYNTAELSNPVAVKNEAAFFMGAGAPDYPYKDPELSPGSVVFLLGKLDSTAPLTGVSGDRVLLGKVTFTRTNSTVPLATPDATFGLSLGLGRTTGTFQNFVGVLGTELDTAVNFSGGAVARQRGDANADTKINSLDYARVKAHLVANVYSPYSDCNADGKVNSLDYACIRNKM